MELYRALPVNYSSIDKQNERVQTGRVGCLLCDLKISLFFNGNSGSYAYIHTKITTSEDFGGFQESVVRK